MDEDVFKLIRKKKGFEVNANQKIVFLSNERKLMKFLRMIIYKK
jgi:type IV secretory pathway VirB4 component